MKIKIFLSLIALIIAIPVFSQRYAKSQFSVFAYSYDIDERIKLELSPLEGSIKYNTENDQQVIEAMLVHSIYTIVTKCMEDSLGTYFLAPNSFQDKIKYDKYGYPDISIQKAIRLGDTKYFLKISVIVENEQFDINGKKKTTDEFQPKVTLTLSIYNKYGFEPLSSVEAVATAVKPVKLFPEFLAGMNFVDPSIVKKDRKMETLYDIVNRAALSGTLQLKYKKNH
jgi:hypothetical protein